MTGLIPWLAIGLHPKLVLNIATCLISERARLLPHDDEPPMSKIASAPSRAPNSQSRSADVLGITVTQNASYYQIMPARVPRDTISSRVYGAPIPVLDASYLAASTVTRLLIKITANSGSTYCAYTDHKSPFRNSSTFCVFTVPRPYYPKCAPRACLSMFIGCRITTLSPDRECRFGVDLRMQSTCNTRRDILSTCHYYC